MADQAAAQSAPGDTAEDTSGDGSTAGQSYTIEITVSPDGFSVGVESADAENAEESGSGGSAGAPAGADADGADSEGAGDADSGAAQPAKSFKDALLIALQIYKAGGTMPEPDNSDSDFASGYNGGQS